MLCMPRCTCRHVAHPSDPHRKCFYTFLRTGMSTRLAAEGPSRIFFIWQQCWFCQRCLCICDTFSRCDNGMPHFVQRSLMDHGISWALLSWIIPSLPSKHPRCCSKESTNMVEVIFCESEMMKHDGYANMTHQC